MSQIAAALAAFRGLRISNPCNVISQVQIQQKRWKRKDYDRRFLIETSVKRDTGTQGEGMAPLEMLTRRNDNMFPDADTPTTEFNGILFKELPICHIRATKNNTLIAFTDHAGQPVTYRSCGLEGFKNARKGTNIAAQATAISVAKRAVEKGIHTIRVKVEGIGPGRMSSVKGLQMAGLKIVSITDSTHISWHPPRPRKARRL